MHSLKSRAIIAVACTLLGSARLSAQASYDSPKGRVEVLGLERWTLKMLQDSVSHYVPGQQLHDAACMATLRYKLNFRDAYVSRFLGFSGKDSEFLSIRLVEPGRESAQWRALPQDEFHSMMPDYAPLLIAATDSTGGIWPGRLLFGMQFSDSAVRAQQIARAGVTARADDDRVRAFLAGRRSESDHRRAVQVLDSNSVFGNRIAAALVLSNFPERDDTWHALVRALRDPHETVRGAASAALRQMPRRPVNWAPAGGDLRALLGGIGLGDMEMVMSMLATTQVSPALSATLVGKNDAWIMRLLTAEAPTAPRSARALLVALNNGTDLGTAAAWKTWMAGL
ncbi:MAG: hypothetical protein V4617_05375 [Gemmatimonadota bacterium]